MGAQTASASDFKRDDVKQRILEIAEFLKADSLRLLLIRLVNLEVRVPLL
jgi:hypothetical protein